MLAVSHLSLASHEKQAEIMYEVCIFRSKCNRISSKYGSSDGVPAGSSKFLEKIFAAGLVIACKEKCGNLAEQCRGGCPSEICRVGQKQISRKGICTAT